MVVQIIFVGTFGAIKKPRFNCGAFSWSIQNSNL